MLQKAAWVALAAAALAVTALTSPIAQQTGELKDRDLKELGSILGKALDPDKQKPEDKDKAVAELKKFLEKVGKTRNPKEPLQGGLALTTDLSKGLHLSADYKMAGTKPGAVSVGKIDEKTDLVSYALWLPKAYKPDGEPYPLILCLPGTKDGKVQSGEAFLIDNWTDSTIREKALIAAVNMPEEQASWTEGTTTTGKAGGIRAVMLTLGELRQRYTINSDRVYISGRESGVAAAVSLASKFPHLFAGVVGRSGDCGTTPVDNFRGLPTYFAGAGAEAAAFAEKNKAAEYNNCTLKSDGNDADAWAWMSEHPRVANPVRVTLYPGKPIPSKAYWLRVQPTDVETGQAKVDAEIDRSKNTVTITGTGIRQVSLMLNDLLVDLDKPVTVVLNGTKQDALMPRSLSDMLAMMYSGFCEPGRVYVVRKDFDLPVTK